MLIPYSVVASFLHIIKVNMVFPSYLWELGLLSMVKIDTSLWFDVQ